MPLRCRSCDSSRPDGPPPTMQTWVFMDDSSATAPCWAHYRPEPTWRGMDRADDILYKSNMPRSPLKPAILTYNLFGEDRDLPDVVHCETIAARSVLHDWQFPPHRHGRLHQVLLIANGGGRANIEGREFRLRPMVAVNMPAGHVHGYEFKRG